jgi:Tol biopolymer transport system component
MTTRTEPQSPLRGLVLLLSLAAACATPTGVEREAKQTDLDKLRAAAAKVDGQIVWTSARDGIPHIFAMKVDGSAQRQVTSGNHTDWYPRFSPDGTKILFSRSRAKGWVRLSQANEPKAWDLYTINVDGSDEQKVIKGGVWGTWINANEILFVRGGQVIRAKLDGGEEDVVLDASEGPFSNAAIQQPQLSPDGKYLALTLGGARRQVGIWKVKKKVWNQVGAGAQATWSPDGAALVWADTAGKEFAGLSRVAIEKGAPAKDGDQPQKPTTLVDAPGKRSREAFPRFTNDGKWVVFGAGISGVETDIEDYELYLWEVGAPPETTARLTYYTGNDSWPDIFAGGAPPAAKPADEAAEPGAPAAGAEEESQKAEKTEKAATDEASAAPTQAEAAAEESAPAAEEEAAPSKAKGNGKKPAPKAKKKRR